jgi:hypothetical protein
MGIFDVLTGSRAPPKGVPRKSVADLRHALLALNRDSAPWQVRDGKPEGADLVAEWRIVDARWYEVFAKANLTKVFRILMKFDEAKGEVRAVDEDFTVEWRAGVPTLSLSVSGFRGQKVEMSFGTAFAFKEDLGYGKVYEYRFKTAELKAPLMEVVASKGWGWRGLAFGSL